MAPILASGPAVSALRRYDSGLRVRWSPERDCWAVDAPAKRADAAWLVPPVRFERVAGTDWWEERLLPENSERYIQYHDRRYVICWARHVDMRLYRAVVLRDSHRMAGGAAAQFDRNAEAKRAADEREAERRRQERVYQAWDLFRFHRRRNPGAEDGTGVSVKGVA